jgi:hypothetical protein
MRTTLPTRLMLPRSVCVAAAASNVCPSARAAQHRARIDHLHGAESRQRRCDVFDEPARERVLRRVARQVLERGERDARGGSHQAYGFT